MITKNEKIIKKAMIEKEKTLKDVAQALNINVLSLNRKLKNKTQFKLNEIKILTELLDVNPNDLF